VVAHARPHVASWGILAAVGIVVATPLLGLLVAALTGGPFGEPGPWTLDAFRRMSARRGLGSTARTTLAFATLSTALSVMLATGLAWVTERTDLVGRAWLRLLLLVPLAVPGLATVSAWALILNEQVGIANAGLVVLGFAPVFDAYTFTAMVWVDGSDSLTLPYLLIAASLRAQDASLEEASEVAGARRRSTLARVTLPLALPAILAAALLTFIRTVDGLQVPVMLGLPGGIRVLATEIYLATRRFPIDLNLAAAFATVQLGLTLGATLLYWRVAGREQLFRAVTGRGSGHRPIRLRRSMPAVAVIAWGTVMLTVLVPLVTMITVSLMPFYSPPSADLLSHLDASAYRALAASPRIGRATATTAQVAVIAAAAAVVFGAVIAWLASRRRSVVTRLADTVAMVPLAIPGLVLGLSLMWVALRLPFAVYGTPRILVAGVTILALPYAVRAFHVAVARIDTDLEDAARVAGASPVRTFATILVPLALPVVLATMLFLISRGVHALSLPVLLAGPGLEMLAVVAFDLHEQGRYPELHALGVLMSGVLATLALAAGGLRRLSMQVGPGKGA
jgi:iron(III) transport system permease protein